jgi:hypothetical protein
MESRKMAARATVTGLCALQKVLGIFWLHMANRTAMTQRKAIGLALYRGLWCRLIARYQQERRVYAATIESELSEAVHDH